MAAVDHDHFEASPFAESGHMTIGRDDLGDHFLAHGLVRHTVGTHTVVSRPLAEAVGLILVGHIGAGEHTGMAQLDAGDRSVPPDGVGSVGGLGQGVENAFIQAVGVAAVGGVHHQLRDGDGRGTALGAVLVKGLGFRADAAIQLDVRPAHGGGEHAVLKKHITYANRCAQMRIFTFHLDYAFFPRTIHDAYEQPARIALSPVMFLGCVHMVLHQSIRTFCVSTEDCFPHLNMLSQITLPMLRLPNGISPVEKNIPHFLFH